MSRAMVIGAVTAALVAASRLAVAAGGAGGDAGGGADRLVDSTRPGITIDWRQGTVVARAGCAADWRLPTPEVARVRAERHARATAKARLEGALRALPLGSGRRLDDSGVARALNQLRTRDIEYQSNGGAVVTLEVGFGDWDDGDGPPALTTSTASAKPTRAAASVKAPRSGPSATQAPAAVLLRIGSTRLAAAPLVVVGGREIALRSAQYRVSSAPPAAQPVLRAKSDARGRLVIDKSVVEPREVATDLAGKAAVIYVQKLQR